MVFRVVAKVSAALALVGGLIAVPGLCLSSAYGASTPSQAAVEKAIARVRPALVRIHVVSTEYQEGREIKQQSVGSGAIISKDGYLVTNHHVAGHAVRLVCTLWNREEMAAELVGTDPLTDIAVLKLKPVKPQRFTPAVFGDSTRLRVGEAVLAMGSPMALSQSVTRGIISNLEMVMPRFFGGSGLMKLDGEDVGSLIRWIGHDAAIYGGNSGGPLVNMGGEIVGINEIQFGLSGAIPGNLARSVAEEIIAHGSVRRSWVGLDVQPLFKDSPGGRGVLIGGVIADSPAARAGLQAGDLLVQLDGAPVQVRYEEQMPEFMRRITSLPVGRKASLIVVRGGKEVTLHVTPVERGELNLKPQELKAWGLTACDISHLAAKEMKRPGQAGVMVTSVRPGGPAGEAKPALQPRDVLVEVNGTPVGNLQGLAKVTRELTSGKTDPVPVIAAFERQSQRFLSVIRVGLQEPRDPGLEVAKAWLPVETHVLSRDIARQLGKPGLKGFYITQVYPRTTAEKAGLRPGDFIVAVDDQPLSATGSEHEEELATLIRQYDIGATVQLTLLRDQASVKVPVELARSPKLKRELKKYRNDGFEFSARDVSFFDIAEEQWPPEQRGALIEEVKSGGWAELGSLQVDDLVVEVDGQPIQDVDGLKTSLEKIAQARKPVVTMKVLRGIHTAYLELEPSWRNNP